MLKKIKRRFSIKARSNRGKLFLSVLSPKQNQTILDFGGGNGSYINSILNEQFDVTIADISEKDLLDAKNKYHYKIKLIKEDTKQEFEDKEFDIVFCNSVIEHVTIPKEKIWDFKNTKDFKKFSMKKQKEFANEIRRISNSYFVQTPNKYFFIESHTSFLNLIIFLPRRMQIIFIKFFNKFWFKKTSPDWNLLTIRDMKFLFPDAEIYLEKAFGMVKSIMAIKK